MDFLSFDLVLVVLLFLFGFILTVFGIKSFDDTEVRKRINTFIVEPRESSLSRNLAELQNQSFSESFMQRTVFPWANNIIAYLGRFTPGQSVQEMNRKLMIAGNPYNFRAQQFYGLRLLFSILGILLALLIYQQSALGNLSILVAALVLIIFALMPNVWLNMNVRRRQDMIRRNLPDALDMLSVCTAAGLSFDQSMLRVGQTFKTPIGIEFARVVSEIEIGISRQQALRNLQARVDISELSSFVAVILQSELLGMSISDVLRAQAEQMRVYRQYRAKEAAQQLPAKMMVPLVFFIFPALLAVLLGPTIPSIMEILK